MTRLARQFGLFDAPTPDALTLAPTAAPSVSTLYETERATLFHADCRTVLAFMIERGVKVDVVIADPPYGVTTLPWDQPVEGWLSLIPRILRPHGSLWLFGSMRSLLADAPKFLGSWVLAQDLVWEKHNGSNAARDRFRRVHEHALHLYPKGVSWSSIYKSPVTTPDATAKQVRRKQRPSQWGALNEGHFVSEDGGPRLMRSVIQVRSCHGYAVHPTQKPVGILAPLVEFSCPPGGTVLDPFAGSGSTLITALTAGRRAIGIELHRPYADAIVQALASSGASLEGGSR